MSGASQSVDPLDSLLDFSDYDGISAYHSPSLSPAAAAKTPYVRPASAATTTPTIPAAAQPQLTGPSHQYDLYKQQTGLVPGALASTLAVNQSNLSGYTNNYNLGLMSALSPDADLFDFNSDPSQGSLAGLDVDMDFDSPAAEPSFFFPDTVNPTAIGGQESAAAAQTNNIGRLYPGMHSQAALAKAQAQQRQQQQIIMQQRQQQQQQQQQQVKPRTKSAQPSDPIVEQKITQLLNSMRARPSMGGSDQQPMLNIPRLRKDEDDMDEDERLLASEEGKKLSSKERRQLRNKVSARAFRSRRKEYITQLEAEIANKVSENGDLRVENRALMEENKRLSDLTRMLLSSPSFSNFLDHLSSNPSAVQQQVAQQVKMESRQEQQQQQQQQQRASLPKDANPYAATTQQQIGMAMIPEQSMDFSMLSLDNFQPQVYAVLETPEVPAVIDTAVLSGKTSNFVGGHFGSDSDSDKVDMPVLEHHAEAKTLAPQAPESAPAVVDDEFENDPEFALYHSAGENAAAEPAAEVDTDIFSGIESAKILARYELVDASEEEQNSLLAMARVQRIAASMDHIVARLDRLMIDQ